MYCIFYWVVFTMHVKCPYCGCSYNISVDSLPKPLGDLKLGYGWWLRCCKCHKKWWLKNSAVQLAANTPIKADINKKINNISKLRSRRSIVRRGKTSWKKLLKWFVLILLIAGVAGALYNKQFFKDYLVRKIEHLSGSMLAKLRMLDVQYSLEANPGFENEVLLIAQGKIINNDKRVIKLNGIKVVVYDSNGTEVISWTDENIGAGYIVSGETLDFSTQHPMPKTNNNIRVEVSIL